eukprot:gene2348-2385_t
MPQLKHLECRLFHQSPAQRLPVRLIADQLELIRNERRLFSNVSFTLDAGDALILTGANGSGKSSLLRACIGLLPFNHGTIQLQSGDERHFAEQCHYIGHQDGLKTSLTAAENLDFWAQMLSNIQETPKNALKQLNMGHIADVPVAYLSAGQRRRVALARLLVAKRNIWMLDEPTTALDAATQTVFATICCTHLAQGGLILAATHLDLGFAAGQLRLGATGLVFFLILVSIIPFALGPDLNLLARIGPAIIWIAALLSTLLGLDRLFQSDEDDGTLDLLMTAETPLELIVLVKCAAHWLTTALPLIIATPLFALMLAQDGIGLLSLPLTLLAGTPALTLLGAIGAAITVSLRRGGLLMAVLILPMTIPVLIFGVSAAEAALGGTIAFSTPLSILAALSLAALAGAPFAAAAALREK